MCGLDSRLRLLRTGLGWRIGRYTQARMRADVKAHGRYDAIRAGRGDEPLNVYGSAEFDAIALEAIMLWTADLLPLADIEFAVRMATGKWD
jgi:hypothetical protein